MELVGFIVPFTVVAVGLGAAIWFGGRQKKQFLEALAGDGDVTGVDALTVGVETKRAPVVRVLAAGGGKNNAARWDATALCPRLGVRTSLHLTHEGLTGSVRELFGVKDVHTGDEAFDEAYTVRGSDPDVVRGVLRDDAVRDAVRALFAQPLFSAEVKDGGAVVVRFRRGAAGRGSLDPHEAKACALAVARFVTVLEEHAHAPAAREPMTTSMSGGATGAPVGVPIGGRD